MPMIVLRAAAALLLVAAPLAKRTELRMSAPLEASA
jgi:hypothetical protein